LLIKTIIQSLLQYKITSYDAVSYDNSARQKMHLSIHKKHLAGCGISEQKSPQAMAWSMPIAEKQPQGLDDLFSWMIVTSI